MKKYTPRLFESMLRQRSFKTFDAVIDLLTPPLTQLIVASTIVFLIHLSLGAYFGINPLFVWLWILPSASCAIHVLVGLRAAHADRELFKTILYVPRYAVWKVKLYLNLLIHGRPNEWIRTKRE